MRSGLAPALAVLNARYDAPAALVDSPSLRKKWRAITTA
jgi:hypothetical protein